MKTTYSIMPYYQKEEEKEKEMNVYLERETRSSMLWVYTTDHSTKSIRLKWPVYTKS